MRTEAVQGDDFSVTVRGKIRRTGAYQSEYLLHIKQTNPTTQALDMSDRSLSGNAAGWAVLGIASTFSMIAARVARVLCADGQEWLEPFQPEQLRFLFNHYLDSEQLPDRSDLWSRVEDTIERMDAPPKPDPKAPSDT